MRCTPDSGARLGHRPLLARGTEPHGGVPAVLRVDDEIGPQRAVATDWRHNAPSQAGTLPAVPTSQSAAAGPVGPPPAAVLGIVLCNTSNHCYVNEVVLALLWTAAHVEGGWRIADMALSRLLRWLTRARQDTSTSVGPRSGIDLWDLRGWRDIVYYWQDPHRQQDAGEFLQHLAPRITDSAASQGWQSRTQATSDPTQSAQVSDQGTLWPLVLAVSLPELQALQSQPLSLQQLLIAWRNQAARHAILEAPDILALQINRFHPDGSKVHTPIGLSTAVYIPQFSGEGLRTTSVRYVLEAVVYHLGPTMRSGYYRTALCVEGRILYVTDDAMPACSVQDQDVYTVRHNAYMFLLRKH